MIHELEDACDQEDFEEIKSLLKSNIPIGKDSQSFTTPFFNWLYEDKRRITKLISLETNLNIQNANKESLLFDLTVRGDHETINELLKQNIQLDYNFANPLHASIVFKHLEIMTSLLEAKANINGLCDGCTPLFHACVQQNFNCVKILLESKADINIKNSQQIEPLIYASSLRNWNIVEEFLNSKIPIPQDQLDYVLIDACQSDQISIIKKLIQMNVDINKSCSYSFEYFKPLDWAIWRNSCNAISCLISNGATTKKYDSLKTIFKDVLCWNDELKKALCTPQWVQVRLLLIANRKESSKTCYLSLLPKDIIHVIIKTMRRIPPLFPFK